MPEQARNIVMVLNGPNLNLLGTREPEVYGATTLDDIAESLTEQGDRLDLIVDLRQSNHEGHLIDWLHEAQATGAKAVIINPGAFTHTSIALHDAIKGVDPLPVIECHVSNVHAREAFRHHSWISPAAAGIVIGFGVDGYLVAMDGLVRKFVNSAATPAP